MVLIAHDHWASRRLNLDYSVNIKLGNRKNGYWKFVIYIYIVCLKSKFVFVLELLPDNIVGWMINYEIFFLSWFKQLMSSKILFYTELIFV